MMDPMGAQAAMSATRRIALSALPNAPVVPEPPVRPPRPRVQAARRALARGLYVLAERVEPRRAGADCC